jgi:hypothetical protein
MKLTTNLPTNRRAMRKRKRTIKLWRLQGLTRPPGSAAKRLHDKWGGVTEDEYDFPPKPPRMRWATYSRLEAQYDDLENRWALGIMTRFARYYGIGHAIEGSEIEQERDKGNGEWVFARCHSGHRGSAGPHARRKP